MGVPGFFVWLMKNNVHNNIIINNLKDINNLYFDANCLFHPKCFDILKLYSNITDIDKLEELMIKRIIKYIKYIIDFVKPTDNIYIAVDGVAPVAKINQQRKRRYKSVIDKKFTEQLNKKYNINKNTEWSNIVITPGTNFMIKLDNALEKFKNRLPNIIYSSYKEPGEGEHKIIRYIKQNEEQIKKRHVIYGLDADLIFLALSAYTNNSEIFLLRELQHLKNINQPITDDVNEPLCYLSIKNVINTYNEYIINKLEEYIDYLELDLNSVDFSKDFIILCFLLGNDFIPHIPTLNIRINGIEYLIEAYCKMYSYTQSYIYNYDKKKINWNNLKMIFEYIGDYEHEFYTSDIPAYKNKNKNRRCNATIDYDRDIWNRDNLKDIEKTDLIQLGIGEKKDYKFRYYEIKFNSRINQDHFIDNICKNYIEMIQWICNYYFDISMPSWQFCYYFDDAPFASDLIRYINDMINNNKEIKIPYKETINMDKQLLSVIPYYYNDILKDISVNIDKFKDIRTRYMFPNEYKINYDNDIYWLCEVELPMIDFDLIK